MHSISSSSSRSKITVPAYSIPHSKIRGLELIEKQVIDRLTTLHNRKIKKISVLSQLIDERNQAESMMIKMINRQQNNRKEFISEGKCETVVKHYYALKTKEQQLTRKLQQNDLHYQEQQTQRLIEQIIHIRQLTQQLQRENQKQRSQFNIEQKIKELRAEFEDIAIEVNSLQIASVPPAPKPQIQDLLRYIQEEQNDKRLLHEDLVQFQTEMQNLRIQNQALRQKLNK